MEVGGGHVAGTTDLRDSQWHHVAAVFPVTGSDVTHVSLYVDGVLQITGSSLSQAVGTDFSAPLVIGSDANNQYFKGLIDELHIRSRELTPTEISDEFNAGNQTGIAWHARYFHDAAIDWDADDDNDALSRLQEYAFAGNPTLHSPGSRPHLSTNGAFDYLTFSKPVDGCHNIQYTFEESTDLSDWAEFEAIDDEDDTGPYPCTETILYEAGEHTPPRRFLRVRTELVD